MFQQKNKEQTHEKQYWNEKKNDYTNDNLLDYEFFPEHQIAIDLSKQIELENPDLKQ